MTRNEQLELARNLGAAHFAAGGRCTPASDRRVLSMLEGRGLGVTPEGEAPTILILKAWSDGWTVANLRAAA